jgi:hypothetical protein
MKFRKKVPPGEKYFPPGGLKMVRTLPISGRRTLIPGSIHALGYGMQFASFVRDHPYPGLHGATGDRTPPVRRGAFHI